MAEARWQKSSLIGIVAIVLLSGLLAWTYVENLIIRLEIAFARDQVTIFESFVERATAGENLTRDEALQAIKGYYRSGTKQAHGSSLDAVVESARRMAKTSLQHAE